MSGGSLKEGFTQMPSGQPQPARLASFAIELAMAARQETLRPSRVADIENKGRGGIFDPVTAADRASERAMRALIMERFPDHGIYGEEFADKEADGPFAWSLDPIDGTRSYICGLPVWTTLIALLEAGEPVVGVIDTPRLDEMYIGTEREAAIICNGERSPIRTSDCKRLDEARFSTTDPFLLGSFELLDHIARAVRVTRFGLDGYAYARLASGSIDLVIENGLKPYDYSAVIPLIRAAGGHVGNWVGGNDFAEGKLIAAASSELYEEAVELIAEV